VFVEFALKPTLFAVAPPEAIAAKVVVDAFPVSIQFLIVLLVHDVVAELVMSIIELLVPMLALVMVSDGVVDAPIAPLMVTLLVDASVKIDVVLVPEILKVPVGCIDIEV